MIIFDSCVDSFSSAHQGADVKLSIDEKKIAYSIGDIGEENLYGFERAPTLKERQERLHEKKSIVAECTAEVKKNSSDKVIASISGASVTSVKNALMITLTNTSGRIKELRLLIVKPKQTLEDLLKKVDGHWTISPLAPAISFWQCKLLKAEHAVQSLLDTNDMIGYAIACMNGRGDDYICGQGTSVSFDKQPNYVCLKYNADKLVDRNDPLQTDLVKQNSETWYGLRQEAKVTGTTIYRALGLSTLCEQKEHYAKQISGEDIPISPELQALFDYGKNNEINALATTVCKIIPIYYPRVRYVEDWCSRVLTTSGTPIVVSSDGKGVNEEGNAK